MQEKVVLIGAGSAVFTRALVTDMVRKNWEGELGLVDTAPDALDVATKLARKVLQVGDSRLVLSASTDRRQLLPDTTIVICTIGVGGRRAWEQDVFVPRKHGIFQPVGDSVMPGGTSRALRMIPAMVDIARDVLALAPNALFFNYSNPMSAVCRGVRKATGANMVGLCHGVTGVANRLATLLEVPADRLRYTAVGINHLTWFTEVRVDGQDAMPKLREIATRKLAQLEACGHSQVVANLPDPSGTMSRDQAGPSISDPLTWQLFALTGAYPAPGDSHVAEFFPHMFGREKAFFGKTLGIDAFGGHGFESIIERGDQSFAAQRADAVSPDPLPADYLSQDRGYSEKVTDILNDIRQDAGNVYSVNLPNRGQVPNLPADAVVESPAVAQTTGLRPLILPPLPPFIAGTLASRFQWVETVVEAALEGSRDKFVQALVLDGAVGSVEQAQRLADDLLAVQKPYLPQFARR